MTDEQPAFTLTWDADGPVAIYRVYRAQPQDVDRWHSSVRAALRAPDVQPPIHVLLDLRAVANHMIFPGVVQRARQIADELSPVPGRTALLLHPLHAVVARTVLRTNMRAGRRQREAFTDEAEALRWLRQRQTDGSP